MKPTALLLTAFTLANGLSLERRASGAKLVSISATGDGCPPGSFSTLIDAESISAKASFDIFAIAAGNSVPVTNQSLACDVSITISFPDTCKQAVLKTRTDAYVLLAQDAGATAKVATDFSVNGGSGSGSPPELVYTSLPDKNNEVDIGRTFDVTVSATGASATFAAHLGIFLDAPDATLGSQVVLDGFGLLILQDGLC